MSTPSTFYPLPVARVTQLGQMAKKVEFDVPDALYSVFSWLPGQHITLRLKVEGQDVTRSYTICSSPHTGEALSITVKRVQDGLVSNFINDHCEVGDIIEILPPAGSFYVEASTRHRRTHYLFAAGSGITPIYSMFQSILLEEPDSFVFLLYGNTDEESILFREELQQWCEGYPKNCVVRHILSRPRHTSSCWRTGRIDEAAVRTFIRTHPPIAQDAHYSICGPGTMNEAVQSALTRIDVPKERIHMESFGGANAGEAGSDSMEAQVTFRLHGKEESIHVRPGQTLLQGILEAGIRPTFACQAGVCGACRAQLSEGEVHMRSHSALDEEDCAQGAILLCQAEARTPTLTIQMD